MYLFCVLADTAKIEVFSKKEATIALQYKTF